MEDKSGRFKVITFCALAAIAFVVACVAHEAIGHGGVCLAVGGKILLLTTVYFRCAPGLPIVDAAGPIANFIVAAVAAVFISIYMRPGTPRVFAALLLAFNGFWAAGYLIFSAITNTGDWAYVLRELSIQPIWLWRIAMAIVGTLIYAAVLRLVGMNLPTGKPLLAAYLTAGVVACVSTLFYPGAVLPALREAAQESLLANIGLVYLAFRRSPTQLFDTESISAPDHRATWVISILIVAIFWILQGHGISGT